MPNKSRHRMSGRDTNLKFEHPCVPLIGALFRYAAVVSWCHECITSG